MSYKGTFISFKDEQNNEYVYDEQGYGFGLPDIYDKNNGVILKGIIDSKNNKYKLDISKFATEITREFEIQKKEFIKIYGWFDYQTGVLEEVLMNVLKNKELYLKNEDENIIVNIEKIGGSYS